MSPFMGLMGFPTYQTVRKIFTFLKTHGPTRFVYLKNLGGNPTYLSRALQTLRWMGLVKRSKIPTEAGYGYYVVWEISPRFADFSVEELVEAYKYILRKWSKTHRFIITLTDDHYKKLKEKAEKKETTATEYLLGIIFKAIYEEP